MLGISRLNGWSVALFGGLCLLVATVMLDPIGIGLSLVAVSSGAMEIRGRGRLRRRDASGMDGLIRAQLLLLTVILVYCASRVFGFDAGYLRDEVIPEARQNLLLFGIELDAMLREGGLTVDDLIPFVRYTYWLIYSVIALVACFYQGGLALYYRRRRPLVEAALAGPPPVAPGA